MVYIETPHLLLRDWEEEDILPFVRMNSDKEVMEFFLTTLTEEETMAFYCRIRKEFEEYGYGLYAVECKETQNCQRRRNGISQRLRCACAFLGTCRRTGCGLAAKGDSS